MKESEFWMNNFVRKSEKPSYCSHHGNWQMSYTFSLAFSFQVRAPLPPSFPAPQIFFLPPLCLLHIPILQWNPFNSRGFFGLFMVRLTVPLYKQVCISPCHYLICPVTFSSTCSLTILSSP